MRFKKLFSKKRPIAKTVAILDIVIKNVEDNTMFTCLLSFGGLWILYKIVFLVLDFRFQCKQLESKERLEMKRIELEMKKIELAVKPQQSKRNKRKKS